MAQLLRLGHVENEYSNYLAVLALDAKYVGAKRLGANGDDDQEVDQDEDDDDAEGGDELTVGTGKGLVVEIGGCGSSQVHRIDKTLVLVEHYSDDDDAAARAQLEHAIVATPTKKPRKVGTVNVESGVLALISLVETAPDKAVGKTLSAAILDQVNAKGSKQTSFGVLVALSRGRYEVWAEELGLKGDWGSIDCRVRIVPAGSPVVTGQPIAVLTPTSAPKAEAKPKAKAKPKPKTTTKPSSTSTRKLEPVHEAPKLVAVPKDRASLLALLASRSGDQLALAGEDIERIRQERLNLSGIVLSGEKLKGVRLWNADLSKADLSNATLVQFNLDGANLEAANLRGATLEIPHLDGARLCRADLTNASLKDCSISKADFSDVSAQGLNLSTYGGAEFDVKFRGADLRKARISGAIYRSDFRKANLAGAVLKQAQLLGSDFSGCDLSRADFTDAGLQGAKLTGVVIDGAKFGGATYTKETRWPGDPPAGTVLVRK